MIALVEFPESYQIIRVVVNIQTLKRLILRFHCKYNLNFILGVYYYHVKEISVKSSFIQALY